MLNDAVRYRDGQLCCDDVPVAEIAAQVGTPVYIYSLTRAVSNLRRMQTAFTAFNPHIHYSAKANANLAVLRALIDAGAGIDTVSGGEIFRALKAGAKPEQIVFAGVGKTAHDLRYALEQRIGWFNVESSGECDLLNRLAGELNTTARVALRFNPDVQAQTHPHIATGHGGAKFGMAAADISTVLNHRERYPHLSFAGLHIHIGSQLHDTSATETAVRAALDLIAPYPDIGTVNIGGGLPVAYHADETIPALDAFAAALTPLLGDYDVILEPGRSIIADAGLLVTEILYIKEQAGRAFIIVDAGMNDLVRPALYDAHHEIVPVILEHDPKMLRTPVGRGTVVGPVCETADRFARDVHLMAAAPGDRLALLTAGAYGMVMASNYNARPRPAEVVVAGDAWRVARQRETWEDLVNGEC